MDPIAQLNAPLAGRYELEREIGQGGMARVYLASSPNGRFEKEGLSGCAHSLGGVGQFKANPLLDMSPKRRV